MRLQINSKLKQLLFESYSVGDIYITSRSVEQRSDCTECAVRFESTLSAKGLRGASGLTLSQTSPGVYVSAVQVF